MRNGGLVKGSEITDRGVSGCEVGVRVGVGNVLCVRM